MGRANAQSHAKRQREFAKKEKQRLKGEKRAARKVAKMADRAEADDAIATE